MRLLGDRHRNQGLRCGGSSSLQEQQVEDLAAIRTHLDPFSQEEQETEIMQYLTPRCAAMLPT